MSEGPPRKLLRNHRNSMDVLVSSIFSPREVTFLISGVFLRGQLSWMYCLLCTCFCKVEISPPEAKSSTSIQANQKY